MKIKLFIHRLVALFACICIFVTGTGAAWAQALQELQFTETTIASPRSQNRVITVAATDPTPTGVGTAKQNLGFDITAPTITHLPSISKGIAGEIQTIVAEISDNQAVQSASLVYRNSSAEFYSTVNMSADVTNTTWLATVDTTTDDTAVQYYIVAEDTDGNRVQKGSESNPLTLRLQQAEMFAAIAPISNDRKKWIGIGLGVFVIAALIASSAGGDGGGDGLIGSDGTNTCCTVTFVVPNVSTD